MQVETNLFHQKHLSLKKNKTKIKNISYLFVFKGLD